jgi:hypothetical protein
MQEPLDPAHRVNGIDCPDVTAQLELGAMVSALDPRLLSLTASGSDGKSRWLVFDGRHPIPPDPDAIGQRVEVEWADGEFSAAESVVAPLATASECRPLVAVRGDGQGVLVVRVARTVGRVEVALDTGSVATDLFDSPAGDRVGVTLLPAGSRSEVLFVLRGTEGEMVGSGRVAAQGP